MSAWQKFLLKTPDRINHQGLKDGLTGKRGLKLQGHLKREIPASRWHRQEEAKANLKKPYKGK